MLESSTINDRPEAFIVADNYSQPESVHRKTHNAPASLLGDHSVSDPPDPISNSAVKPDCADGTTAQALEE